MNTNSKELTGRAGAGSIAYWRQAGAGLPQELQLRLVAEEWAAKVLAATPLVRGKMAAEVINAVAAARLSLIRGMIAGAQRSLLRRFGLDAAEQEVLAAIAGRYAAMLPEEQSAIGLAVVALAAVQDE